VRPALLSLALNDEAVERMAVCRVYRFTVDSEVRKTGLDPSRVAVCIGGRREIVLVFAAFCPRCDTYVQGLDHHPAPSLDLGCRPCEFSFRVAGDRSVVSFRYHRRTGAASVRQHG